jgi:uncharacterized delta-60 repeat protein
VFLFGHGYWGGVTRECEFASTNPAGLNDITFGGGSGSNTVDIGGEDDRSQDAVVDAQGGFLVAVRSDASPWVIRLDAEGYRDYSFNNNVSSYGGYANGARRIGFWPDGKILVIGTSFVSPHLEGQVTRLNIDGTPDETFGANGRRLYNWPGTNTSFTDFAWDPEGRLVLCGQQSPGWPTYNGILVRLQPNGDLDSTFGEAGLYLLPHPVDIEECGMTLCGNGRIFIASGSYASDTAYVSCYTTDLTTGLSTPHEQPLVRGWPNPVREHFQLEGLRSSTPPIVSNAMGQVWPVVAVRNGTGWLLEVSHLPPGLYIAGLSRASTRFLKE